MVADRPAMARIVSPGDAVWSWAARRFDGEGLSYRIYWNSAVPRGGLEASHMRPHEGHRAWIRLARRDSGSQLWNSAVFELLNQAGAAHFDNLHEQAFKGLVSRSAWLKGNLRIEFTALKRLQYFGKTTWKHHAAVRGFKPDLSAWYASLPESFNSWYNESWITNSAAGKHWLNYYDNEIVPYVRSQGMKVPD